MSLAPRPFVLLVDSDCRSANAVAGLLGAGHEVAIADGACDALRRIALRVPDAILADFDLPNFRGDALLEIVAREHPAVRRVLCTGELGPLISRTEVERVAHATLVKPVRLAPLLSAIGDRRSE